MHKQSKFAKQSGRIRGWVSDKHSKLIQLDLSQTRSGASQTPQQSQPIKPERTSTEQELLKRVKRIERQGLIQTRLLTRILRIVRYLSSVLVPTSVFVAMMQTPLGWMFFNFFAEVQKELMAAQINTVSQFIKTYGAAFSVMIGDRTHLSSIRNFVRLIWRKLGQ